MEVATKIWHNLPEDLLMTVLKFLPPKSIARFRAVSSDWHKVLTCARFISSCIHMRAWLILNVKDSIYHKVFTLEPSSTWCELGFMYLPSASNRNRVVAASGGLVCVQAANGSLFVCNPCTGAWTKLPPLIFGEYEYPVIGMIKSRDEPSYRVVVTGLKHTTEVYDSSTRQWRLIPGGKPSHDSCTTFYKGVLYSAGIAKVLTYDVEQESWREIEYPVPWPRLCAKRISEYQGRLFLVASDSEDHVLTVWTLDVAGSSWSRVHSLSLDRVHRLPEVDRRLIVDGHRNFVIYAGFRKLMAFSLLTNMWYQFSTYPNDFPFNFFYKHTIFQLQPSLEAAV
ncbi:hypothetical protein MPTK2_1g05150 [Marchantia polymorpha subsp. ruderalis]